MNSFLFLAPILLGVALASYDPYTTLNMAKLYRMQQLANVIDDYLPNEQLANHDLVMAPYSYWPNLEDIVQEQEVGRRESQDGTEPEAVIYNDPRYSGAHLRDMEHLEHSNLHGFQSVSGGTAEGSPNEKQVKSDKSPAYCNPPNPCSVGKIANDNCVENFENSAENNQQLLFQQKCPCDTEHMFKCPTGSKTVSSKGQEDSQQEMTINKVMGVLAKMEQQGEKSIESPTRKRMTLVAKKSPHSIRKRSEISDFGNPYLHGARIAIAAKKDPAMAKKAWLEMKRTIFEI